MEQEDTDDDEDAVTDYDSWIIILVLALSVCVNAIGSSIFDDDDSDGEDDGENIELVRDVNDEDANERRRQLSEFASAVSGASFVCRLSCHAVVFVRLLQVSA